MHHAGGAQGRQHLVPTFERRTLPEVQHTTMAKITAVRFPTDLLLMVKGHIGPWDLRTHVCFYQSSLRAAALYDDADDPDAFWERACWHNGFGAGLYQSEESFLLHLWGDRVSWKKIAIDTITRDGFCQHPACGERLLEYNRERMCEVANDPLLQPLIPLRINDQQDERSFKGHMLFKQIEFRHGNYQHSRIVERDAHLRAPGGAMRWLRGDEPFASLRQDNSGLWLDEHPLIQRSFATFAPVSNIMLSYIAGKQLRTGLMDLGRTIIAMDVIRAVHVE
ncbi:hypothetical protein FKP32DRAFT_828647 [Trametes sanguinea]|nr:hypothetical protein FKP32DRAFT_828647 [Trametes sanguinea]